MITKHNLKDVLDQLTKNQIDEAMDSDTDHVALYITGNYGTVFLEPFYYTESKNSVDEILNTGGVICDKDDFLRLADESKTSNQHLLNLIN